MKGIRACIGPELLISVSRRALSTSSIFRHDCAIFATPIDSGGPLNRSPGTGVGRGSSPSIGWFGSHQTVSDPLHLFPAEVVQVGSDRVG